MIIIKKNKNKKASEERLYWNLRDVSCMDSHFLKILSNIPTINKSISFIFNKISQCSLRAWGHGPA